jgi:hypothetical protein
VLKVLDMANVPVIHSTVMMEAIHSSETEVLQLLVTANAVPSPLTRFTLMMEATRSSETLVLQLLVTANAVPSS